MGCFIHAGCGERLASAGYAVYGVDYEGHGRSGGVRCLINKFDNIVDDCEDFFKIIGGEVSVFSFISNNPYILTHLKLLMMNYFLVGCFRAPRVQRKT